MRTFSTVLALILLSGTVLFASAQMDEGMGPDVDADSLGVAEHDVLGTYLVDDAGRTLYVVVDGDTSVPCEGECAEAWPPYVLDDMAGGMDAGMEDEAMDDEAMEDASMGDDGMGEPGMDDDEMGESSMEGEDMQDGNMDGAMVEGGDVDPSLIGTITRQDGSTQVTYDGRPLYYFTGDVEPGEVNCQAVAQFGGTWYVLAPDGEIIRTSP